MMIRRVLLFALLALLPAVALAPAAVAAPTKKSTTVVDEPAKSCFGGLYHRYGDQNGSWKVTDIDVIVVQVSADADGATGAMTVDITHPNGLHLTALGNGAHHFDVGGSVLNANTYLDTVVTCTGATEALRSVQVIVNYTRTQVP